MAVTIRDALRVKALKAVTRIKTIRTRYGLLYKQMAKHLRPMELALNDITARMLNLSDQ